MDNRDYNITGLQHAVRIDKDNNETVLKLFLQGSVVRSIKINSKTEKGFRQALQELSIKGGINNLVKTSILNDIAKKIYLDSWNSEDNAKISPQTIDTYSTSDFTQKIDKLIEIVSRNEIRINIIEERIQNIEKKKVKSESIGELDTTLLSERKEKSEPIEQVETSKIEAELESEQVQEQEPVEQVETSKIEAELESEQVQEQEQQPVEQAETSKIEAELESEQVQEQEQQPVEQDETNKIELESNHEKDLTNEQNDLIEDIEEVSTLSMSFSENIQETKEFDDPELETKMEESNIDPKNESEQIIDQNIQSANQIVPAIIPNQIPKEELELEVEAKSQQKTESELIPEKKESELPPELEKKEKNQVNDQSESNKTTKEEKKIENNEDEEF